MKNVIVIICFYFVTISVVSQVGINTTNPETLLDIRSSNQVMPANNDGVLIPKVDNFPVTNPTANMDGMLVFCTGIGTPIKGFYYWNQTTLAWVNINGAQRINDLSDGKTSDNGLSIYLGQNAGLGDNAIATENTGIGFEALMNNQYSSAGNVAVGFRALTANTNQDNVAIGYYSLYSSLSGSSNVAIGSHSLSQNITGEYNIAIGEYALGNSSNGNNSVAIGRLALNNNSGNNNIAIGNNAGSFETGSNKLYIENTNSSSPLIYGEFDNDLLRVNGTLEINNAYQFPLTDGIVNQVLRTDGSGNVTWSNSSGAERINDLLDGKSDNDGTNDGSSIFLGIDAGLNDDLTDNRNIGIGRSSLLNNTSGSGNIAIGDGNLLNNATGLNNIAIGLYVLPQNNGDNNVAVGPNAMLSNTSGNNNTAVGGFALRNNTTGQNNSAFGLSSLNNNTIGQYNNGFGYQTLRNNIDGSYNEAFGSFSLYNNTIGVNNIAIGYTSLYDNTDGVDNIALGVSSLANNISGYSNVAIGTNALNRNNGNGNIGIGFSALSQNTSANDNIAIGFAALENNVSGTQNIALGSQSLLNNINGFFNMAFGRYSLNSNTTGAGNVAMGHGALRDNVIGNDNVAIGVSAGDGVNGDNNVFLGQLAGSNGTTNTNSGNVLLGFRAGQNSVLNNRLYIENSNNSSPLIYGEFDNDLVRINGTLDINNSYQFPLTDGMVNQVLQTDGAGSVTWGNAIVNHSINDLIDGKTFNSGSSIYLGSNAGNPSNTGTANVGIGYESLSANIGGVDNTALGHQSLVANTFGRGNTAIGANTLSSNTTGENNISIGFGSLDGNTIGNGNIALGNASLYSNIDGGYNIAIGQNSMLNKTTGSQNIALGFRTLLQNTNGTGNVAIGYEAGYNETGSNKLYIENSNVDANNALIYGEFDNNLLRFNADVEINTGALNVDGGTLFVNEVNNRVGIGTIVPTERLAINGAVNLNQGIGTGSVALRVNGSEALWYNGTYFSYGFGGTANYFSDNVGIGIGAQATNPNAELVVVGDIEYTGTITDVSDRRLKENFKPINNVLERIKSIKGYSYNMIADETTRREYGIIAQDLQKVFPEMVRVIDTENQYLGVSYIQLIPVLLEAIKEQQLEIDSLKTELSKHKSLETRLSDLEQKINN